ncbi:unnamed protein product [Caretta caretta]
MNSVVEVDVLRSTYRGVFTAVSRQLTLYLRLRLLSSFWWSTGVNGTALSGRSIASIVDAINGPLLDQSLPANLAGTVDKP